MDLIYFSSLLLLDITGCRWDRQWLVVNNKGRAYTQRVEPKLALVEVELPNEAFSEGWEPTNSSYMGKFFVYLLTHTHIYPPPPPFFFTALSVRKILSDMMVASSYTIVKPCNVFSQQRVYLTVRLSSDACFSVYRSFPLWTRLFIRLISLLQNEILIVLFLL